MTPSVLDISSDLRLVRLDAPPAAALSWYQDPETLWMVDGKREPYTPERLARMYDWLAERGELWFIEVRDEGTGVGWRPVGDVTLCPSDLPIVIGEKDQRARHVGRRVIGAPARGRAASAGARSSWARSTNGTSRRSGASRPPALSPTSAPTAARAGVGGCSHLSNIPFSNSG